MQKIPYAKIPACSCSHVHPTQVWYESICKKLCSPHTIFLHGVSPSRRPWRWEYLPMTHGRWWEAPILQTNRRYGYRLNSLRDNRDDLVRDRKTTHLPRDDCWTPSTIEWEVAPSWKRIVQLSNYGHPTVRSPFKFLKWNNYWAYPKKSHIFLLPERAQMGIVMIDRKLWLWAWFRCVDSKILYF